MIDLAFDARRTDLGGFEVGRILPFARRRMVVPYLLQGRLHHRDRRGVGAVIRPREVNAMTAGRGVTHSERTDPDVRGAEPPTPRAAPASPQRPPASGGPAAPRPNPYRSAICSRMRLGSLSR
jgi:redox-sensitive bicupin YhaK (pirin superfamily)